MLQNYCNPIYLCNQLHKVYRLHPLYRLPLMHTKTECSQSRMAIQDTLEVISGKWKLLILITLIEKKYRFKELAREVGISPRMLSKELQDMEMNQLISRTVYETKPVTVEYAVTPYGKTLKTVMWELAKWGQSHRRRIMNGK